MKSERKDLYTKAELFRIGSTLCLKQFCDQKRIECVSKMSEQELREQKKDPFVTHYLHVVVDEEKHWTRDRTKCHVLRREPPTKEEIRSIRSLDPNNRDDFFKARLQQVSSTEGVCICGYSLFSTVSDLLQKHLGHKGHQQTPRTGREMEDMNRGHFGEPQVKDMAEALVPGMKLLPCGTCIDPEYFYVSATPDSVVQLPARPRFLHMRFKDDPQEGGLFESKFVVYQVKLLHLLAMTPDYMIQLQFQMQCADAPWVEFWRMWVANRKEPAIPTSRAGVYLIGHIVGCRVYRSRACFEKIHQRVIDYIECLQDEDLELCKKLLPASPELGKCSFVRYIAAKFYLQRKGAGKLRFDAFSQEKQFDLDCKGRRDSSIYTEWATPLNEKQISSLGDWIRKSQDAAQHLSCVFDSTLSIPDCCSQLEIVMALENFFEAPLQERSFEEMAKK